MYQDGIGEGKSIGASQERINISYGINGFTEGTDDYYYIYVYMTDGTRTKGGWVNTGIQVPQDPGPGPGPDPGGWSDPGPAPSGLSQYQAMGWEARRQGYDYNYARNQYGDIPAVDEWETGWAWCDEAGRYN